MALEIIGGGCHVSIGLQLMIIQRVEQWEAALKYLQSVNGLDVR